MNAIQNATLTFAIRRRRQHGHGTRFEHLLIQVFLLQPAEFVFQLAFVDRIAGCRAIGDCIANLVGKSFLLAETLPGKS